ncbi:SRPBCC domain-containing protein [Flavobacterium sediminilitoris]|uniref:SRPBCC domain-containing protein n=1 Tax=Flavobacterium sediminilitoris TaxID=2024526 RepID=A0ABY4HMY7_9FLAO|nr:MULTISPECIES: SRPBCC domain-containing protein [Flavobacterium]UOX33950.1 SRPBCC domain-containing protein [Flavobacterium sediminilitoris]
MEQKTNVIAENGKQEILITRTFDLPVELLFKAYTEPELIEQWMGTKVLKFNFQKHGNYQFSTTDQKGNEIGFNGTIHDFKRNQRIIRTFEMESMPFGVQLEIYEFEKLTETTSNLKQQVIYQSVNHRDQNLKLPFKQGINWAHNRLEEIFTKSK